MSVFFDDLPGWCTPEKAAAVADIVARHERPTYVEVGVFGGRCILSVAASVARGRFIAVDPWDTCCAVSEQSEADSKWWGDVDLKHVKLQYESKLDFVRQEYLSRTNAYASTYVMTSLAAAQKCLADFVLPDVVYIDGNHSFSHCFDDLNAWVELLNFTSLAKPTLIVDDLDWQGPMRAYEDFKRNNEIMKSRKFTEKFIDVRDKDSRVSNCYGIIQFT